MHPEATSTNRDSDARARLRIDDVGIAQPTRIPRALYSHPGRADAKLLCPRLCPASHSGRNPAGSRRAGAAPPMQAGER
jgi:hypothetical protein